MSASARQVERDRAARDAARARFDGRYGSIKSDMEERGVAGRIIDETLATVKEGFDEAVAVAEERPAMVGGTLAILALWIFKGPIIDWATSIFGRQTESQEDSEHD